MSSETRIANAVRYGPPGFPIGLGAKQALANPVPYTPSAEELAAIEESRRRDMACTIVAVAEELVTRHAFLVADAFERANELYGAARDFVTNFKLPQE